MAGWIRCRSSTTFRAGAAAEFAARAAEHKVAVIVRVPFDESALTGSSPHQRDGRKAISGTVISRGIGWRGR